MSSSSAKNIKVTGTLSRQSIQLKNVNINTHMDYQTQKSAQLPMVYNRLVQSNDNLHAISNRNYGNIYH